MTIEIPFLLTLLTIVPLIAYAAAQPARPPGVYAHFQTTMGSFVVRLFAREAPRTVDNFINLATGAQPWRHPVTGAVHHDTPFYDGVIFHRVIGGFMIQGGDPSGTGRAGPGYTFPDEFHRELRHDRAGILSMANAGPDTNGSQFFITLNPQPHLDNRHAVFGEVVAGLDVVAAIGAVRTGANDRPVQDVVMEKVTIEQVEE